VIASPIFPRKEKFDLPVEYRQYFGAGADMFQHLTFSIQHLCAASDSSANSCSNSPRQDLQEATEAAEEKRHTKAADDRHQKAEEKGIRFNYCGGFRWDF
jgi:hypothetical protein